MDRHLSEVKLLTDGHTLFEVEADEGRLLDALREGQMAFFMAMDRIARSVAEDVGQFELDREEFLRTIRNVEDDVSSELAAGS